MSGGESGAFRGSTENDGARPGNMTPKGSQSGLGILESLKQSRNKPTVTRSDSESKIKEKVGNALIGFFGGKAKDTLSPNQSNSARG